MADDLYNYAVIQQRAPLLSYVYSNEIRGWHTLQNQSHTNARASQQLLGDKRAFAKHMTTKGYPVIDECANPTHLNDRPFSEQFKADQPSVFCKLRQGNQALHAFAANWIDGRLNGQLQTGEPLNTAVDVDAAWERLITHGEPIVQQCLRNHPEITPITGSPRIANLRVVTRGNSVGAATMTLYTSDQTNSAYWLDIEPDTGRPYLPTEMYPAHHPELKTILPFAEKAPEKIPFWDEISAYSLRAHNNEFDLWAIAWDWAVTPEGPMLLEGNAGWGLDDWQLQCGSLLLPYDC
jgi:hypothetical protein